ncbi:hypothetical protein BJ508DRAFT_381163 [Ascobolus immersus RN42]|uniref:Uncharacterized protein n=1 Tax=Ascobolus immersus RN42 TaxID=1160509 RepID=A0A3N4HGJ3_ASCIM|nr:hypothetical protein BJ508DRAFT_381163 [Ascobolus immersus RN42]
MATNTTRSSAPPFLRLPPEIHDQIGAYLPLPSLQALHYTCRLSHSSYEYSHIRRLGKFLRCKVYVQHFKHHQLKPGKLDDEMGRTLRDIGPHGVFRLCSRMWRYPFPPEKLVNIMKAGGLWDTTVEVVVVLEMAVYDCICEDEGFVGDVGDGMRIVEVLVERLMELGGVAWPDSKWPVTQAVGCGRWRCLELFHRHGFTPKVEDKVATTGLLFACLADVTPALSSIKWPAQSRLSITKFLLEQLEADPTRIHLQPEGPEDELPITAFIRSTNFSLEATLENEWGKLHQEVLRLLIEKGVDLHAIPITEVFTRDPGWTRLTLGVFAKAGYDVLQAENPLNPFMHVVGTERNERRFDPDVMQILLNLGCTVDQKGFLGETALHKMLLIHVREKTRNNENMNLSSYDFSKNIRWFMKNGADPFIADLKGFTPITLAMVLGYEHLIYDLVDLDVRRNERYGSLTAKEVYERWRSDDKLWKDLLPRGTWNRFELEPMIVQLPSLRHPQAEQIDYDSDRDYW